MPYTPPVFEVRDEAMRAPIEPAVCCVCGEPANHSVGCLVALAYVSGLHAFRWCHRRCGVERGLFARYVKDTPRRRLLRRVRV
jgi:hypothetical protein